MSVLYSDTEGSLLDQNNFINKVFETVAIDLNEHVSFRLHGWLFAIVNSKDKICRKRSHNSSDGVQVEVMAVTTMYKNLLPKVPDKLKQDLSNYKDLDISSVRDLSKDVFERTMFDHAGLDGGNNSDFALKCQIKGEEFLIPPRSRFFCGDVHKQCLKLSEDKFNLIVADPPWWNKYIRRLKDANNKLSYSMMYNEAIASIPVKGLLSQNCIVAVWCTNSPSNIAAVKDIIFPQWGVEYLTTWYWLKVTTSLQPMGQFGTGSQKQPYERIMIGKVGDVCVPDKHLVVSIPSALHSHKPPLLDLLLPLLKNEKARILELFARYLLPDTTSIGYEPLKWQHLSLYEQVT